MRKNTFEGIFKVILKLYIKIFDQQYCKINMI